MKLLFKTLKGEQFRLDVTETASIPEVKQVVSKHLNNSEAAAGYRLIHAGKVLKDSDTLDKAGVTEKGFLVVMPPTKTVQKSKPQASGSGAKSAHEQKVSSSEAEAASGSKPVGSATSTASSANPSSASQTQTSDGSNTVSSTTTAETTSMPVASERTNSGTGSHASAPNTMLMGAEYDAMVRQICDMGFSEDEVKRALRAAFNNPDRAVEYLFSGIPDMPEVQPNMPRAARSPGSDNPGPHVPDVQGTGGGPALQTAAVPGTPFNMFGGPPAPGAAAHGRGNGSGGQQSGSVGGQGGNLDFLRQLPQFNIMRRMIQANPALLAQLLQQLDQVNPALLRIINENQSEFVRLINEPIPPGEEGGDELMEQLAAAMAGGDGSEGARVAPQPGQIFVTEEENQQLTRLTELGQTMGLERIHVVEAWLACDRDENLAANYLFENMEEIRTAQEEDAAAQAEGNENPSSQNEQDPANGSS